MNKNKMKMIYLMYFAQTKRFENEIMEIKNEYYKPRSLGTDNELDVIMDAILNQNSMAMDSAYVDDV